MASRCLRSEKGLALLLVIGFIAALVVSGVTLNRQVRGMLISTTTTADYLKYSEMCRSGIEAAAMILETGENEDIIDWLLSEETAAEMNDRINRTLSFNYGSLAVTVYDERARIQVNALVKYPQRQQFNPEQQQLWDRLLRLLKTQSGDDLTFSEIEIIDSLKDWLDDGDDDAITGLSGAESDYYAALALPYGAANAPVQHIGELLLIKGMTPELFHGTPESPGLSKYVTAGGAFGKQAADLNFDGKVNINTAEALVLAAILPAEYQSLTESIIAYRQDRINAKEFDILKQPAWYKNAPGCANIDLPADLVTVTSDLFRVTATAFLGERQYPLTALVNCQRAQASSNRRCEVMRFDQTPEFQHPLATMPD